MPVSILEFPVPLFPNGVSNNGVSKLECPYTIVHTSRKVACSSLFHSAISFQAYCGETLFIAINPFHRSDAAYLSRSPSDADLCETSQRRDNAGGCQRNRHYPPYNGTGTDLKLTFMKQFQIDEKEGIPVETQLLILRGMRLDMDQTVAETGMNEAQNLYLLVKNGPPIRLKVEHGGETTEIHSNRSLTAIKRTVEVRHWWPCASFSFFVGPAWSSGCRANSDVWRCHFDAGDLGWLRTDRRGSHQAD